MIKLLKRLFSRKNKSIKVSKGIILGCNGYNLNKEWITPKVTKETWGAVSLPTTRRHIDEQ